MSRGSFSFFSHRSCEYFPCHSGVAEQGFNCLFCFCPLYALGRECGGRFTYTRDGIKDCGGCALPHLRENYDMIIKLSCKVTEIVKYKEGGV